MASDTMPLAWSDVIGHPSCMYLSQDHGQLMHIKNCSKFYNSIKIFDRVVLHCDWHVYDGSVPGLENRRAYGRTCASHISPLNIVFIC
jgi:hypothetical protein